MAAERIGVRLALAGDTMLGRAVAMRLRETRAVPVDAAVIAAAAEADLFVLNLECCVSERGRFWPDPRKPFFFRAPPVAAELLAEMGVDCVSLANNHALDYGPEALLDTFEHLGAAGVAWAGAGPDAGSARAPWRVEALGLRLAVIAASDHPAAYAAGRGRPGIAFSDLRADPRGGWLADAVTAARRDTEAVLVTPHWGPNMTTRPPPHVRRAAEALIGAGGSLVAGHSAHVPHGAGERVLYDLGDFVDDYVVHRDLRNDLGLLFLVDFDVDGHPRRVEAIPLALGFCRTRLATGDDAEWMRRRFLRACAELGTRAVVDGDRVVAEWA